MLEEMIDLQLRPVNALEFLLRNAGHAVERLAQQQGTLIEFALPEVVPALYTDPRLAQQVFVNLLELYFAEHRPHPAAGQFGRFNRAGGDEFRLPVHSTGSG